MWAPPGTPKPLHEFGYGNVRMKGLAVGISPRNQASGEGNLTEALPAFPEQLNRGIKLSYLSRHVFPPPIPKRLVSK